MANTNIREAQELQKARNKKLKAYMVTGFATLIAVLILIVGRMNQKAQEAAALNALPLLAASLSPSEALVVANTIAAKGGEGFRYVLAHSLERMNGARLLDRPPNSGVYFEGQGTVVFQFDKSNRDKQKLKVFRVCDNGEVDMAAPVEIPIGSRDLLTVGIGPPVPSARNNCEPVPSARDNPVIVTVFKADNKKDLDLEAYSLSWPGSSPAGSKSVEKEPIAKEPIKDVDFFSPIAFDSEGRSAVISTRQNKSSTLWQLQKISENWEFKELKFKRLETSGHPPPDDESVVTAVAFRGGNGSEPVEERLITGRLNGAIYCGSKLLESQDKAFRSDTTAVLQISSPRDSKNEDWFAYKQASGRVLAWRCENRGEAPFTFMEPATTLDANVSSINLNYLPASSGSPVPLVTYVDSRQLKCWTWGSGGSIDSNQEKKWWERECNSTYSVDQVSISRDARHVVTIEGREGRAAVYGFPLQFLTDTKKNFVGRLAHKTLFLWNAEPAEIQKSAPPPSNNQMVSVKPGEQSGENVKPEYKVSLVNFLTQFKTHRPEKNFPDAFAVADNNLMAIAIGNELWLSNSQEGFLKRSEEHIVCLGFSPDKKKFVFGTEGGKIEHRYVDTPWESLQPPLKRGQNPFLSPVTACAVSNDETIVGGFTDGSVWVFKPGQILLKPVRLSPRAIYQFAVPVKAVSLEKEDTPPHHVHVAALWEWQANGCTRPGLPGQSVQIWDLQRVWERKQEEPSPPVSNMCFPNQRVTTIGSIRRIESGGKITDIQLPVVFGQEVKLIPCQGCARGKETNTQILTRLMKEAEQLGARDIDDEKLATVYGIRF